MKYHKYVHSSKLVQYYKGIAEVNSKFDYPECVEEYEKLMHTLGNPYTNCRIMYDYETISGKTLIANIDAAFSSWQDDVWSKHLSFDDFCEYLLPYRVWDEPLSEWRVPMKSKYVTRTTALRTSDDMYGQAYWAAYRVNDELRKTKFHNQKVLPSLNLSIPAISLLNMKMGECKDYAIMTAYVMRACGIPVGVDFTPQWPDRSGAHHWNVLLDNSGKTMPFMGGESQPGTSNKPGRRMAKAYRLTYAFQPNSLFAKNEKVGERIPYTLDSPFMKDVSSSYFDGVEIPVKIRNMTNRYRFVYLTVFDNQHWVPVDYAEVDSGEVLFRNMGKDIVYLPAYWGRNGVIPAGNPIYVNLDGVIEELIPDTVHLQTITLSRKYPQYNRIVKFRDLVKGGHFEASSLSDFSDAISCAEISKVPTSGYDTIKVNNVKEKYRYWRFVSPEGGKCNIAEINFLHKGKPIKPKDVLFQGRAIDDTNAFNVFDGDQLSYYITSKPQDGWVGVDFGEPVSVDSIAYLPRNDDNDVVAGQTYELCYYENGRERSAGIKHAESSSVTFVNVPSNTVYILHNLEKGTEERIFLFENGKIKWY